MSKSATILSAETDKAHFVAQGILCSLAAVCSVGVIWAVGHTPERNGERQAANHASLPPISGIPLSSDGTGLPSALPSQGSLSTLPQTLPPPSTPVLSSVPSGYGQPSVRPTVPPGQQLVSPQLIEAVQAARQVRELGDTVAALESLRTADIREPNHPEIIGEMALTYEIMGLTAKARDAWKTVLAMGEGRAGGYYVLAQSKLDGVSLEATGTPQPVQLGKCEVIREPMANGQGEKVTVRVPILASPGVMVDPSQMDIHVFLFEQVNDGERIEQVRAEAPTQNWVSMPVDWMDPAGETVDISYNLPAPKPEEIRDLGKRSFHGYLVKLFYQDKLAGQQAQPEDLTEFPPRNAPAGLDNALFPR